MHYRMSACVLSSMCTLTVLEVTSMQLIYWFINELTDPCFFLSVRCNLRILDSFGTDAEFNCPEYKVLDKSLKSTWGGQDVHLRQIMTMFRKQKKQDF